MEAQPGIDFGGFVSPLLQSKQTGVNWIDSSDMSLLRDADKTAAGEVISHEMMEASVSRN